MRTLFACGLLGLMLLGPATAQQRTLLDDFADGFLFHGILSPDRKTGPDGAVSYWTRDSNRTGVATVRQSPADACVFVDTSLTLNGEPHVPVVLIERTFDLRKITFENLENHEFKAAGGTYARLQGPRVVCETITLGQRGALEHKTDCKDVYETTIEEPMMVPFNRAVAALRDRCGWR